MDPTFLDPVIDILEKLFHELPQIDPRKDRLPNILLDLRFLKMFFWALKNRNGDETVDCLSLCSAVIRIMVGEQSVKGLDLQNLVLRIEQLKPQIIGSCIDILGSELKCSSPKFNKFDDYVQESINFLVFSLRNVAVLSLLADRESPVKQQIQSIVKRIRLIANFVDVALGSMVGRKSFEEFLSYTQTWATHISWIACIHWINGVNEDMERIFGNLRFDLMQKTMLMWLHLNLLRAAGCRKLEVHHLHQFDSTYVDFLLQNLNGVEVLKQSLAFLTSFVVDMKIPSQSDAIPDPPREDSWLIWTEIHAIISEVPSVIRSVYSGDSSSSKTELSDFLEKIDTLMAEIRKLHVLMPSESSFPKANPVGFLDFLVKNVKRMLEGNASFNPCLKFQIVLVLEELESLRSCLNYVLKLLNEDEEIKNLWKRIVSAVYTANYAVKLSSLMDVPVWYSTIFLSNVIENMKLIRIEVKRVEDGGVHNCKKLETFEVLPQACSSRFEGVFIGFEEDARTVIDHLVRGPKGLKIISISGMPGQGKTTLARRIYPEIQYWFHRTAWCYVSKECRTKDLLIGVLRGLGENLKTLETLNIQDLLERLWRSLKGSRYMIVMDDIWDVEAWRELQGCFPDDSNGSRILFTTRNHNLASQAKENSISHPLRLFSEDESWQLMEKKLLQSHVFSLEFLEIAKQIAIYCKGLPLAVSLISSVLGRTGQDIDSWEQVSKNLKSHLANEGCGNIIELSYKYLPECLKPCFLHFSTFPRGKYIRARKMKQLWIAEGFVQEDLANAYLEDLVSQNLVIVRQRGSNGGIKTCFLHDLLYDLCSEKVAEENFLQFTKDFIHQGSPNQQACDHYRLCIRSIVPFTHISPKKMLVSQVHSLRCFDHYLFCSVNVADLTRFKVLTVLDLEYVALRGSLFNIPEELLSFVHLRYLAIYAAIEKIPHFIARLWNLETLIIKGANIRFVLVPIIMFRMENLKHFVLDGSYALIAFFSDFVPEEALMVCNIERFVSLIIYRNPNSNKLLSLKRFHRLRKLRCCFREQFHPMHAKYWRSLFRPLHKLESLRIDCDSYEPWFKTSRKARKFVGFDFPRTLKKLTLSGLKLPWNALSTFTKMPNLEVLKLEEGACSGSKWDLEDLEFPRLRYLKLCKLDIEQIDVSGCNDTDPFPCLEEFVVDGCERLEEIPSSFGDICTLKGITVAGWLSFKAKDSAMRILEEQREMGNDELQVCIIYGGRNADDDDGTSLEKEAEKRFKQQTGLLSAQLDMADY